MMPILDDLHESATEHDLFLDRLARVSQRAEPAGGEDAGDGAVTTPPRFMPPRRSGALVRIHEMAQHTRQLVLPGCVVGTTAGLLVSGTMTSTNILLNGLAVGFATSVDEMFVILITTDARAAAVDAAYTAIDARRRSSSTPRTAERTKREHAKRTAAVHSAYVALLTAALLALLLQTERMMALPIITIWYVDLTLSSAHFYHSMLISTPRPGPWTSARRTCARRSSCRAS